MEANAAFGITLFSLASVLLTAGSAQAAPERYILKLRSGGAQVRTTLAVLQADGVRVESSIPQLDMVVADRAPQAGTLASALVAYAVPDGVNRIHEFGSPVTVSRSEAAQSAAWDMKQINAPDAWQISTGSRAVIAAISDTGSWNHSQLVPNWWQNPGESGSLKNNGVDDDGNGYVDDYNGWNARRRDGNILDRHYHGTHVSGTVGAYARTGNEDVTGVAWEVSLMEVPFIDESGSGSDADGIRTIVYAADNGARVLNASWGSDEDNPAMKEAIEYAKTRGMLLVIAAGNDGWDNDLGNRSFPASYDCENIISVAATTSSKKLASFSNYGVETVDIAAPGDNIYSTWNPMNSPLRRYWYYSISGTSMAAPHVTGAAALLFAVNPALTWREAKEILLSTATPRSSLQGKIKTGGELNVGAAVRQARAMLEMTNVD